MDSRKFDRGLSRFHRRKPYDPNEGIDVPQDFDIRHNEFTIRLKERGLREVGEFNEIPSDTRKEFWKHLKDTIPRRIAEDADRGTAKVSKDPVKVIQVEIAAFRKRNPDFPKLMDDEVEKLFQQI